MDGLTLGQEICVFLMFRRTCDYLNGFDRVFLSLERALTDKERYGQSGKKCGRSKEKNAKVEHSNLFIMITFKTFETKSNCSLLLSSVSLHRV